MKNKVIYLTHEGPENIKAEHEDLIKVKRPAVTQRISRAREFGDLSENSEYDDAKNQQSFIEGRISELEEILKSAKIIQEGSNTDCVVIGSKVKVEIEGEVDEFTVVGSIEADPLKGKISNESPVGQALLGTRVGETVEVATPIVRAKYKILSIK